MVGTRKSLPSLVLPSEIPAELRIDGKSTLLGEKRDEAPKRVYYWHGAVYEATADTPLEWLTEQPAKKRKRSPSPAPPQPPQKRKKSNPAAEKKKRRSTTTTTANTASRAEEAVTFDLSMDGAADLKAAIGREQERAKKKGYRVQSLQDDEIKDNITVGRRDQQDEDDDDDDNITPPNGIQLLQNIHAMSKLNSKIDQVKAKYEQMKQKGLTADALKKRKRTIEEPEDEDILPGSSNTKRARRDETEDDDTTHLDEPVQVPTPDETDQDSFMAQLQAAANAAPSHRQDRETRSQLDSQLRSPSPTRRTRARAEADRLTPAGQTLAEEADTSSSEIPPRRHASSVSMSISTGTSPSIHEAATAPASTITNTNNTTTRSSRPNDHFGKQQPRKAVPDLAEKNRGGQALRWSITAEDITKNPERAESLIQKGRLNGESKQARRRRVAREKAFLQNLPSQEV
ncbi:hypothetical protein CLAFUW4_10544 [Fulvia fulva]|uniref:Uncharacterized protein n=1 Tax=Passalora fulva TaxID=5499 RepID=A0A9Q8LG74_PASFU|nr:uncharacterized protein CLAFUR5_05158 [Fulvia fulva]KAK4616309.1 hypothetical protein CLAFUR4_10549 [Fulvia fulva]KAK4616993.1 hypothetical protein CLAFUR0_10695 [Fulvia fulva]UJO16841.1 hypothetical protein CLAFUR5_05158 [Fulvia fulva]WPV18911.1 hypothetical protein CLAFUW4_10544 [Fulvia fulva]WPV34035.1 hypothetical protein CLAFUW7_10546 [Fulvia fulva]